jgi:hypothetical protein
MRRFIPVVAVLCLAPGPEPAAGQDGLFSVSPSRRVVVAEPPSALGPTVLSNTTARVLEVTARPALLAQNLDGSLRVLDGRADARAARQMLTAQPRRFALGPGEERVVAVRWSKLPLGTRAAQVGLVLQGVPRAEAGGGVQPVVRLVQPNLLSLPGRVRRAGTIESVRAQQGLGRTLRFLARLRNAGGAPETPRAGTLRIRDANGRTVVRRRWPATGAVFPRAVVEVPVQVRRVLPPGSYTVAASARLGGRRVSRAGRFELTGPNELKTPAGAGGRDLDRLAAHPVPSARRGLLDQAGGALTGPAGLALLVAAALGVPFLVFARRSRRERALLLAELAAVTGRDGVSRG